MRGELVDLDLAELADIANLLALESAEVGGDSAVLEVDDTGEGLIKQRANRQDGEVASFGLVSVRTPERRGLVENNSQQACGSWPCSPGPPSRFR